MTGESWVPAPGEDTCAVLCQQERAPPKSLNQDPSSCGMSGSELGDMSRSGFFLRLWCMCAITHPVPPTQLLQPVRMVVSLPCYPRATSIQGHALQRASESSSQAALPGLLLLGLGSQAAAIGPASQAAAEQPHIRPQRNQATLSGWGREAHKEADVAQHIQGRTGISCGAMQAC